MRYTEDMNSNLTDLRLYSQQLLSSDAKKPAEVVSNLLAVQAQDYPGALWSIGLRLPESKQADIETAIARRQIVRTWPMRGTLHLVLSEDIRWLLKLLTPRIISGAASRRRNLELDDKVFQKAQTALTKVLTGGNVKTRPELIQILEDNGIATAGQRGIHILGYLSQTGVLCFGPHTAKLPTFTLLDEWIPKSRQLEHDEALAELARRFFTGHGPATIADLARWSGLPLGEVRKGLELSRYALVNLEHGGQIYWFSRDIQVTDKMRQQAKKSMLLLPGFDEYLLGYKDRSLMLEGEHSQKIVPGNNGMFLPTIVSGGQVVGLWKKTPTKQSVRLTLLPFAGLSAAELSAVKQYAQRYASFLGVSLII
jgi:hypothetical protein